MKVSFEEIGRLAVTFAQDRCQAGQVCKLVDNGLVTQCSEGDAFCGIVESVRGGFAAVQVEGFVQVNATGSLDVGYMALCADGDGGVMEGQGREYLVVSVDKAAATAVIKL